MTRWTNSGRFLVCNAVPRRAVLCQDRESTCLMPLRASNGLKTCRSRRSFSAVGIGEGGHVPDVGTAPIGIAGPSGCCTTWGIWSRVALTTSTSRTPSTLYPVPIAEIFPGVRHQVCEFHVLAEITKAVLHALAKVRKELARQKEPLGRGRPRTKEAKRAARRNRRLQEKIGDLYEHRHLFVAHHLTPAERQMLQRITRGLPQLRTLREIMDEVYRLFDRRCRTDTALAKLAKLRMRVRRFRKVGKTLSKLFSPNLEKAFTFLDDRLLPATSNAVERGNRRHRKMQKTVYRVRTQEHIHERIAMDMLRDAQAPGRFDTTRTLHHARTG